MVTFRIVIIITIVLAFVSCTAVQVRPIDRSLNLEHVCIKENSQVVVGDFLPILRDGFERRGISTLVFSGSKPEGCEFIVKYTALQSWDMSSYLSYAYISIENNNGRRIATAEYRLRNKGGLSLLKFRGTRAKMNPVIDELLREYQIYY